MVVVSVLHSAYNKPKLGHSINDLTRLETTLIMICPKCDRENRPEAKFCDSCGASKELSK